MVNETFVDVFENQGEQYFPPVNEFTQPIHLIKLFNTNGQEIYTLYDFSDLTVENLLEHTQSGNKIAGSGSVGLSNTATITIPNTNGIAWEKIKQNNIIIIYGDYLDIGEKRYDTIIRGQHGNRNMQKLFSGYIEDITPSFGANGHDIKVVCKNKIFKYKQVFAKNRVYRGPVKDSLKKFINDNDITDLQFDTTKMLNIKTIVEIKDISVYAAINKFRNDAVHFAYIDEEDVIHLEPLENLYPSDSKNLYRLLKYKEHLISATIPSYKKCVNTIKVFYGRVFNPSKFVVIKDDNSIDLMGEEISRTYIKRDISSRGDAEQFAINELKDFTKGNNTKCTTIFYPYMKVKQFFKVDYPFAQYNCLFVCDGVKHTISSGNLETEITGFVTLLNSVPDDVINNRRKTMLDIQRS